MSYERSNNRGQIVGTVLGSRLANRDVRGLKPDDRRRRAAIARIELFEPVGKGDLLVLRHDLFHGVGITPYGKRDVRSL